jgi:transposase
LETAVPQDNFYRKMEMAVDLSWVRPLVAHCYSDIGRSSIDPEVFAKIELIAYLEGITSERELMRQIDDRLSLRRYIGYDIDEKVPDHSTLSKIRDLLGKDLVDEIMAHSVRLCQAAGMVGGVHVSGDKTLVKANASLDSLEPRVVRFSPQEFVARLYAENPIEENAVDQPAPVLSVTEQPDYPTQLPVAETAAVHRTPASAGAGPQSDSKDGSTAGKAQGKGAAKPELSNATHVSRSDPDATLVSRPGMKPMLAYSAEMWTDARAGVITHADAATAITPEHTTAMQAIEQQRTQFGLALASLSYDKACGEGRLYRQLKEAGIVGFVPHRKYVNATSGPGLYGLGDFNYDGARGVYVCPAGKELKYSCLTVNWPTASHVWQAKPSDCKACPLRPKCTKAARYRTLQVSMYQPNYEAMDARLAGPGARLAAIARRTGPEQRFAEGKQWQGLARAKYRGLEKFRWQVLLTAAAQNFKKYVNWIWRKTGGAGRARATGTRLCGPFGVPSPLISPLRPIKL